MNQVVAPILLSIKQTATILGVSPGTIRNLIADGRIPTVRIGTRVLIHKDDLVAYVNASKQKGN